MSFTKKFFMQKYSMEGSYSTSTSSKQCSFSLNPRGASDMHNSKQLCSTVCSKHISIISQNDFANAVLHPVYTYTSNIS